jgi:TPR repeat protein
MLNYGVCLRKSEGVNKNIELAAYWFKRSAELGDSMGMVNYGVALRKGEGINQNVEDAFLYFYCAHLLDNLSGSYYTIQCILFGIVIQHDPKLAYQFWTKLPKETFPQTYLLQVYFFIEGTLFGRSFSKAFECFDICPNEFESDLGYEFIDVPDFKLDKA